MNSNIKKTRKRIKSVSDSQRQKNYTLKKIKDKIIAKNGHTCRICQNYGNDLAHLLNKQIWPQYYIEPKNLVIFCRSCHDDFDAHQNFRKLQIDLYDQVCEFDPTAANRYFGMNK